MELEPASAAPGAPPPPAVHAADPLGDPFADLDPPDMPPKQPAAPAKPPVKPAEPPKAPEQRDDKPADKPVDKPKEEPAQPDEPKTPKALREAYDRLKREMKEREARHATEIEGIRKTGSGPDPEREALTKRHAELEARYKQAEEELQYTNFEKSEKFRTEFEQPYQAVWGEAVATLGDYRVTNPDGTERPATVEDLTRVTQAGSMPEARKIAKEIFGDDDANDMVMWRGKIVESFRKMQNAKAEFKKNGATRAAEQQQAMEQRLKSDEQAWQDMNKSAVEKYPKWFKADETDTKGAELLKKGFEIADLAFSGKVSEDKRMALHSAIRNQSAGFRYAVHKWESAETRIAALEKELEGFRASRPGAGNPPSEGGPAKDPLADPFEARGYKD